jgi:hypothetical protein
MRRTPPAFVRRAGGRWLALRYKLAGIRPPRGHPKHIAVRPASQHIAGDPEEYDSMHDEYDSMEDSAHGGLSQDEDYDT